MWRPCMTPGARPTVRQSRCRLGSSDRQGHSHPKIEFMERPGTALSLLNLVVSFVATTTTSLPSRFKTMHLDGATPKISPS